jgi:hypothetical protein
VSAYRSDDDHIAPLVSNTRGSKRYSYVDHRQSFQKLRKYNDFTNQAIQCTLLVLRTSVRARQVLNSVHHGTFSHECRSILVIQLAALRILKSYQVGFLVGLQTLSNDWKSARPLLMRRKIERRSIINLR